MSMLVPVLLAGGGIAYVASQSGETAPPLPSRPLVLAPRAGATIQQAAAQISSQGAGARPASMGNTSVGMTLYLGPTAEGMGLAATEAALRAASGGNYRGPSTVAFLQTPASGWPTSAPTGVDPLLQEKLDVAEAYLKDQWENGNEVAKAAAADAWNKEHPEGPKLTGHESWGDMLAIASGAGATAACASYPYTTAAAPLCGIVGAWLGKKFGDWLEEKWPAIKQWAQDRWDSIEGAASDAYNWAASAF